MIDNEILKGIPYAIIGGVGGMVNHLYLHVTKENKLSLRLLVFNGIISSFAAYIASYLVPDNLHNAVPAIAAAIGFMGYPFLAIIRDKWPSMIQRFLKIPKDD